MLCFAWYLVVLWEFFVVPNCLQEGTKTSSIIIVDSVIDWEQMLGLFGLMNSMLSIVIEMGIGKMSNNISKSGTMLFTPGDNHLDFWGCIKEIKEELSFLLSIGVGFFDGLKFNEGLLIIKGVLVKSPWILGRISLVEHHLIVKCFYICTAYIVTAFEEAIPGLHTITL